MIIHLDIMNNIMNLAFVAGGLKKTFEINNSEVLPLCRSDNKDIIICTVVVYNKFSEK